MKRLILLLFTALQFALTLAQKDSTNDESSTISVETGYSTNTNAFGSLDGYVNQPSFTANADYNGKKGLILMVSSSLVGNSDSTNTKFTSDYDFGAGYSWTVFKILSISPTYTHYLYSKNSMSLKSGFSNFAQLSTGLSIKWWGVTVAAGYGWGQTSDILVNTGTSATIKFKNVIEKDNTLVLQPSVLFALNKNQLINYDAKKKTKGLAEFLKLHPNLTANDFLNSTDPGIVAWRNAHPTVVSNISKKLNNKLKKKNKKTQMLTDLLPASKSSFGLTSINISFPITYNVGDFTFSANPEVNIPYNKTDAALFYMCFDIAYSFGL